MSALRRVLAVGAVPPAAREEIREAVAAWTKRRGAGGMAALVAGNRSTGREAAARAFGGAAGRPVYRVDLGRLTSKYIGETEKNLARLFDTAEPAGAVLFFDEADALFGRRTAVSDSHDRYANLETGYLLERATSFRGAVLLGVSARPASGSPLARRVDAVICLPS